MKLSELIKDIEEKKICLPDGNPSLPVSDPEIRSVHYRSGEVTPGGLFVAIPGFSADGHDFIDEALKRGAAALVVQRPVGMSAVTVQVPDTRKILGLLAARFYGNPSDHLVVIGITGTNGKTTTSLLIESLLTAAGFRVGVIGTIDYHYSGKRFDNPVTTPESPDLQRILAQMRAADVTHVVMEASSHAIDLHRLSGCWLDAAVFTNLTQDHLDYHEDMDAYWACKQRLFTEHLISGPKRDRAVAVVNCNDLRGRSLSEILSVPCFTTGYSDDNMVWCKDFEYDLTGISGEVVIPDSCFQIRSALTGTHNLENILCAVGAGAAMRLSPEVLRAGISALSVVPGRLEPVQNGTAPSEVAVYVDYAHTPDALENVLKALTPLCRGRLICVFGCGGDRDRAKRPLMGEIAGRLSDLAIITSDNPRTEAPDAIIRQILAGTQRHCRHEYRPSDLKAGFDRGGYVTEPDRREAIRLAIGATRAGDIVLIAGKGHETYQIIGQERLPFDDRAEARKALKTI